MTSFFQALAGLVATGLLFELIWIVEKRRRRSAISRKGWATRRAKPEHASYSTEAEPPYPPTIRE